MLDQDRLDAILTEAGRIAMGQWPGSGHVPEQWSKADDSPVCAADLAVNTFLADQLQALLPSAGWLSEETADRPERLNADLLWLVDPIDGTRDFLRGRDGWAVSVALVSAGRPLFGRLYAPARNQMWRAEAGKGATRNGTRLTASKRIGLAGARTPATQLANADADLAMVDRPNSIALRIAMVAADEADIVATLRWGFEWDVGAAALIAREAGAVVTDTFGKPLAYNKRDPRAFGVLATAPAIHGAAVDRLAERAQKYS